MALFKFVKAIKENKSIDVYNNGQMQRDFTYISDLVKAVFLLLDCPPILNQRISEEDSLSPVVSWVINIGNSDVQNLSDFIKEIEEYLGLKAIKNYLPMQKGDVKKLSPTVIYYTI